MIFWTSWSWLLSGNFSGAGSQRRLIGLARADAHRMVEGEHEDLAVADLAGLGRPGDGVGDLVDLVGRNRDFDFQLGQEADRIFGAPIDLGVPLLPPVSLDLGDCEPVHADAGQRVADLVELEWLDNGHDEFHGNPPLGPVHATADRATMGLAAEGAPTPAYAPGKHAIKPRANSAAGALTFWKE